MTHVGRGKTSAQEPKELCRMEAAAAGGEAGRDGDRRAAPRGTFVDVACQCPLDPIWLEAPRQHDESGRCRACAADTSKSGLQALPLLLSEPIIIKIEVSIMHLATAKNALLFLPLALLLWCPTFARADLPIHCLYDSVRRS